MEENISIQQEEEGSEVKLFTFHIKKKLAVLLFIGFAFLTFGVSAFYVGRQTTPKKIQYQIPSVTPEAATIQIIQPTTSEISQQVKPKTSSSDLCQKAGGRWMQFPTSCTDDCLYHISRIECELVETWGCDCGGGKCWDGNKCARPDNSSKPTSSLPKYETDSSCNSNSDCVIKDTPYCCGDKKEYYKWCYNIDENPPDVVCKEPYSCPGLVGSATSCICENSKCTAVF